MVCKHFYFFCSDFWSISVTMVFIVRDNEPGVIVGIENQPVRVYARLSITTMVYNGSLCLMIMVQNG